MLLLVAACAVATPPGPAPTTVLALINSRSELSNFSAIITASGASIAHSASLANRIFLGAAGKLSDPSNLVTVVSSLLHHQQVVFIRHLHSSSQFAPENSAFAGLTPEQLRELKTPNGCLHHVAYGDILTTNLKSAQDVSTLAGDLVHVTRHLKSNSVHIDKAEVVTADLVANNGVVDIIDAVLFPSSPQPPSPATPTPPPQPTPPVPTPPPVPGQKNECNPAASTGCNVCPTCCQSYITDGTPCDNCMSSQCGGRVYVNWSWDPSSLGGDCTNSTNLMGSSTLYAGENLTVVACNNNPW